MSKEKYDPTYDINIAESGNLKFISTKEGWALSLCETKGPTRLEPHYVILDTRDTTHANALVGKIYQAQNDQIISYFHYLDLEFNLIPCSAIILGAQAIETKDGPGVKIWVGMPPKESKNLVPA